LNDGNVKAAKSGHVGEPSKQVREMPPVELWRSQSLTQKHTQNLVVINWRSQIVTSNKDSKKEMIFL